MKLRNIAFPLASILAIFNKKVNGFYMKKIFKTDISRKFYHFAQNNQIYTSVKQAEICGLSTTIFVLGKDCLLLPSKAVKIGIKGLLLDNFGI